MSTAKKQSSYTATELEEETGFDRRTIAYYVQEGLLPRVGRRGPRTRYPGLVRDRLLFVRRVREAEEAGEVSAVSLSDIRTVFERVPPALIAKVADGLIAVTPELVERASTGFRLPAMRREAMEVARDFVFSDVEVAYGPKVYEPDESEAPAMELADALGSLRDRAKRRESSSPRSLDTWTRVAVTPEIELSVRGLRDEDRGLVERVRAAMRRLLGVK